MGLFHNGPYTNFHELNLDWILKFFRQVRDRLDLIDKAVKDAQDARDGAEQSEANAAGSAASALDSASRSEAAATRAEAARDIAETSAAGAMQSAQQAAGSATSAAQNASAAAQSAQAASSSASTAQQAAQQAQTSGGDAGSSAAAAEAAQQAAEAAQQAAEAAAATVDPSGNILQARTAGSSGGTLYTVYDDTASGGYAGVITVVSEAFNNVDILKTTLFPVKAILRIGGASGQETGNFDLQLVGYRTVGGTRAATFRVFYNDTDAPAGSIVVLHSVIVIPDDRTTLYAARGWTPNA